MKEIWKDIEGYQGMYQVCQGRRKTAGGYIWRYANA